MAITATQRTDIVKVVVGLFNAAPGAIYLNNFTAYAGNTAGLTNDLIADPAFTSIYPSFLTSLEFGTKFIDALVGNAAAYTPAGSPVELIARRMRAEQTPGTDSAGLDGAGRPDEVSDGVVIEVRDHGPGVPEADRARIFDRFARLDAGRTRDAGGSGLGLSIAAAIAAAHGGSIDCLPTPGGGATMRVVLPQPPNAQPTNS